MAMDFSTSLEEFTGHYKEPFSIPYTITGGPSGAAFKITIQTDWKGGNFAVQVPTASGTFKMPQAEWNALSEGLHTLRMLATPIGDPINFSNLMTLHFTKSIPTNLTVAQLAARMEEARVNMYRGKMDIVDALAAKGIGGNNVDYYMSLSDLATKGIMEIPTGKKFASGVSTVPDGTTSFFTSPTTSTGSYYFAVGPLEFVPSLVLGVDAGNYSDSISIMLPTEYNATTSQQFRLIRTGYGGMWMVTKVGNQYVLPTAFRPGRLVQWYAYE